MFCPQCGLRLKDGDSHCTRCGSAVRPNRGAGAGALMGESQERTWATVCHLSALALYVTAGLGGVIAPLVIWLIKRNDSPFVDEHGKEAVNFQITVLIYAVICVLLAMVFIGFFLMFVLVVFNLVVIIKAAIKANNGEHYRYPLCLRFIK